MNATNIYLIVLFSLFGCFGGKDLNVKDESSETVVKKNDVSEASKTPIDSGTDTPKLSDLEMMQSGAMDATNVKTSKYNQFAYQIVGGKQDAPVEVLKLDCEKKTLILSRHTQGNKLISEFLSKMDEKRGDDVCKEAISLTTSLCVDEQSDQKKVFDGAGYQLKCSGEKKETLFMWQGTLRKSPQGLRPWHDYTRKLIRSAFPGKTAYP